MLNKKGIRELAYTVKIDKIEPIIGSDNCEAAYVGGWHVMVRKNTFKVGDHAVYFEIDSKLPEKPEFAFLASKHYKVKSQRYTFGGKGNFISQGLLMHFDDFKINGGTPLWLNALESKITTNKTFSFEEPVFLTKELCITYASEEDNKRKTEIDKYTKMYQRRLNLFKNYPILKKIYKNSIGKRILFFILGKKRDSVNGWPVGRFPGVSKTDQERCENMTWVLEDKTPYIVTQKCDGSSGTYILERKPFGKYEFYVCSRNVRMYKPDQKCYYGDNNYYWDAAIKYDIENKMKNYLKENKNISFVC